MFRILLVALLAFGAWKGYEKYQSQRTAEQFQGISQEIDISNNSSRRNRSIDITPKFQCDGRTHCSQMTSCEEATFFLKNCPGTKMDGNNDGVPCEQQRFGIDAFGSIDHHVRQAAEQCAAAIRARR